MRRWTLLSRAERGGVILSGAWTTSTCYKPLEIERHRLLNCITSFTNPAPQIFLCHPQIINSLGNLDQQLAKVAPFQQADQRLWSALDALDHVLTVFDLAAFDPTSHLAIKSRALVSEFALNETADREALG